MKEKIIIFISGLLLGVIISTGSIYVYTLASNSNNNNTQGMEMNGGVPPSMQNGERPEMPNGNNTTRSNGGV